MLLDGHTHIFPEEMIRRREDFFASEPRLSPALRLSQVQDGGPRRNAGRHGAREDVEAAVILGFPWRQEGLWRRHNEVILAAQRRWPAKFFGFCAVHVLSSGAPPGGGTLPGGGFKGVGELAWYEADLGDDLTSIQAPLAELCQHYRVPLMLHTNDPLAVGATYPGKAPFSLSATYQAIKAFPETTWILATGAAACPSTAC